GFVDLAKIPNILKRHCGALIPLVKPKSYCVRVCGQEDTVYAGNEDELEAWKDFYLPERMEMKVIGAIDDFPCEAFGLQLVLLLCEDGNIYAYEDEVLHLVARSLKELFSSGMTFPGIETFQLGECFEYTEEEYNKIMKSSEVKEVKEEHRKFRESLDLELLQALTDFKEQMKAELTTASDIQTEEEKIRPKEALMCWDVVHQNPMPVVPWKQQGVVPYQHWSPLHYTNTSSSKCNCSVGVQGCEN
ncbi:hypothetical protein P4O66_011337, partial [Electrophorus voltai]